MDWGTIAFQNKPVPTVPTAPVVQEPEVRDGDNIIECPWCGLEGKQHDIKRHIKFCDDAPRPRQDRYSKTVDNSDDVVV